MPNNELERHIGEYEGYDNGLKQSDHGRGYTETPTIVNGHAHEVFNAQAESHKRVAEAKRTYDEAVGMVEERRLGPTIARTDIKSSLAPFHTFPEYRTTYPEVVKRGLGNLYREYNDAFTGLIEQNAEWETDYRYARDGSGKPVNGWVQIDMVGLPHGFLEQADRFGERAVTEVLRGSIFEIENSLAMYQLLEKIHGKPGEETGFRREFRRSLDRVREKTGRPIALLAVTDQKHQAMIESEFGEAYGEAISDQDVKELSGFDSLIGPDEFYSNLRQNGEDSGVLYYARTSDPVAKLKSPGYDVQGSLLEDDSMRRIIKRDAITFNVDNPEWPVGDPRRINDTKRYLQKMGMAYSVSKFDDIDSEAFRSFLESKGVDPEDREKGLRMKPEQGTYGCYGHLRGNLNADRKLRNELKRQIRDRGSYVIQPEMATPLIQDPENGRKFTYIDRNFLAFNDGNPVFMSGFRSLIPVDHTEAQKGRIHGNGSTVWAEIS